jgi:hypothetical protein
MSIRMDLRGALQEYCNETDRGEECLIVKHAENDYSVEKKIFSVVYGCMKVLSWVGLVTLPYTAETADKEVLNKDVTDLLMGAVNGDLALSENIKKCCNRVITKIGIKEEEIRVLKKELRELFQEAENDNWSKKHKSVVKAKTNAINIERNIIVKKEKCQELKDYFTDTGKFSLEREAKQPSSKTRSIIFDTFFEEQFFDKDDQTRGSLLTEAELEEYQVWRCRLRSS